MLRERDGFESGGWQGPVCSGCRQPILPEQRSMHVAFDNDRHGFRGLTGQYHAECGRKFASLARVINLKPMGN